MERFDRKQSLMVVGAFIAMLFYVGVYAGTGVGLWSCPFRAVTTFSCFGCGMTRSLTALTHGDFGASIRFHLLGPLFFIGFFAIALVHGIEATLGRRLDIWPVRTVRKYDKTIWSIFAVFVIGFGIVRVAFELHA